MTSDNTFGKHTKLLQSNKVHYTCDLLSRLIVCNHLDTKCIGLIEKLTFLCDLGFDDLDKNIENLWKHKFNLDECVNDLLNAS